LLVIPVFIPHMGCPQHCLFCNQITISGHEADSSDDAGLVTKTVREWLDRCRKQDKVQVAFYGGSFTCLPQERQRNMLEAVHPFIEAKEVHSIRLSTRPDCIDDTVCDFLKRNNVNTVELGVQSLDDKVLQAAWRGHTAMDSVRAARCIVKNGIELGIQLMPGLPGETTCSWFATVREVVRLRPDCVRIYPTLVIGGSGLAVRFMSGSFQPITMNRAIALCCQAKDMFDSAGIRILRMGLQASETLEKQLLAGPYHPSFGEMVTARHWFRRARKLLATLPENRKMIMQISDLDISAFVGQKRININRLQEIITQTNGNRTFTLETDANLMRGTLTYVIA